MEVGEEMTLKDDVVTDFSGRVVMNSLTGNPLRKFLSEHETTMEMRDPDYALKELEKINHGKYSVTCSKCHHCR